MKIKDRKEEEEDEEEKYPRAPLGLASFYSAVNWAVAAARPISTSCNIVPLPPLVSFCAELTFAYTCAQTSIAAAYILTAHPYTGPVAPWLDK